MLSRDDMGRFGPPGFNLGQKEKDYVQHYVLSFLSRSGFGGVFKGGTCLQKAYGLPRFSEDLDFTLGDAPEPDSGSLSAFLASAGFSGLSWKRAEAGMSSSARLRFRGPLYNGKPLSEGTILLEFSKREKISLPPEVVLVTPPYPDLLPYQLRVMDRREIAAEKVRAILTRSSARDLFDLYFLVRQGAPASVGLVNRKLEHYGLQFRRPDFRVRIRALGRLWEREMAALMPGPPAYKAAAAGVVDSAISG